MTESARFERRDIWEEVTRLRAEMDRRMRELLSPMEPASSAQHIVLVPRADVYETGTHIVVRFAVPGTIPEDVDISIEGSCLTVRGEVEEPLDVEEGHPRQLEITCGYFERRVSLPVEVDETSMEAQMSAGILDVRFRLR